jgi:hypothetical protein
METYINEIPEWLLEDDTYLFHGTSNLSEQNLDKGIIISFSFLPLDTLHRIISIYEKMIWFGNHQGGFGVLKNYSNRDHHNNGKYFFLGETAHRCSLYASSDFAGGELVRSVYYCLNDLEEYLINPKFREKHKSDLVRDYELYGKVDGVDLNWLESHVDSFKSILSDVASLRNSFKYGIIYCYKIEKEDYASLVHRNGMGILVKEPLPPERLKAKLVFNDPIENYFGNIFQDKKRQDRYLKWFNRLGKNNIL